MGHSAAETGLNADLTWLVTNWNRLPTEVKTTIVTVARNVVR